MTTILSRPQSVDQIIPISAPEASIIILLKQEYYK